MKGFRLYNLIRETKKKRKKEKKKPNNNKRNKTIEEAGIKEPFLWVTNS